MNISDKAHKTEVIWTLRKKIFAGFFWIESEYRFLRKDSNSKIMGAWAGSCIPPGRLEQSYLQSWNTINPG